MQRRSAIALLLATLSSGLVGCPSAEPAATTQPSPTERVRNVDLPFARRSGDTLSASAALVVIAFDAISIGGADVVPLERGSLRPPQPTVAPIAAIVEAVPRGTTEALLRMHTSTKVTTLLAVVRSLRERGVTRIGFTVRKDSLGENTGTLVPAWLDSRVASAEPHLFEAPFVRSWDQIPAVWDDAFTACTNSEGSFDCSPVTANVAFGADAEIVLFRRANAVTLDIRRFGMGQDVPAREAFMNQQNARSGRMRDRDRDREAAPPVTNASFGFRWASLSAEPEAPLAAVMRALIEGGPVGVRVSGDPTSDAGALVTLIGAAFPDGLAAPAVMLDAQPR